MKLHSDEFANTVSTVKYLVFEIEYAIGSTVKRPRYQMATI